MSEETIERIFNEIATKCGLLTQNHIAFLSSDNTAFRESLTTTGQFAKMQYRITWCVWVFVDYHTIHIQSKSRHTKTLSGDYSLSQLSDAIEDINKFLKEIKLRRVKERIRDIDKDFIDEEFSNTFNSLYGF
jgi:hypothetical protein